MLTGNQWLVHNLNKIFFFLFLLILLFSSSLIHSLLIFIYSSSFSYFLCLRFLLNFSFITAHIPEYHYDKLFFVSEQNFSDSLLSFFLSLY
jgi:hypothetical protein